MRCFFGLARSVMVALVSVVFGPVFLFAQQAMLVPASDAVRPGEETSVSLVWLNDTDRAQQVAVPAELDVVLTGMNGRVWNGEEMQAEEGAAGGAVLIGPGQFFRVEYAMRLPGDAAGNLQIKVPAMKVNPALIQVSVDRADGFVAEQRAEEPDTRTAGESESGGLAAEEPLIASRYASRISFYEPIYFAVGFLDDVDARFQLSMKYRFFDPLEPLPATTRFLQNIYLGYTQISIWEIEDESAPFKDISYKPSFFYLREFDFNRSKWLSGLELRGGYEHESNGRGGNDSRSINVLFIQPSFYWGNLEGIHLKLQPKLVAYIGGLSDNPDIAQYRGHADLRVEFGDTDAWMLGGTFRLGSDTDYYSALLDFTYPLDRVFGSSFQAYFFAQYFYGWGESLIDYDGKSEQFRLGISANR